MKNKHHIALIYQLCSPLDVMHTFYDVRVDFYGKRKNHLLATLTEAWEKLDNKVSSQIYMCALVKLSPTYIVDFGGSVGVS